MAVRTTTDSVSAILGDNYNGSSDLTPYIATASMVVDNVAACCTRRGLSISSAKLELLERWLGAHYYLQMDPAYSSLSVGGSSGSYTGQTGMGIQGTRYGQAALDMDDTGCLRIVTGEGKRVGGFWAGTRAADRRDFSERNY